MKAFTGKRPASTHTEAPDEIEEMRMMRLRLKAQYEEAEHDAALATKYLEENKSGHKYSTTNFASHELMRLQEAAGVALAENASPPGKTAHQGERRRGPEALYREHEERLQRQRLMEESNNSRIASQINRSKVNVKSHKLALQKIRKDVRNVIEYVDEEEEGLVTYDMLGYVFYYLGIFRVLFAEKEDAPRRAYSRAALQKEERRLREEEFLAQFWATVNPRNRECVESDIVEELVEVIFKLSEVGTDEPAEEEEQLGEETNESANRGLLTSNPRRSRGTEDELQEEEGEVRPAIRKYLPREEHIVEHKWSLERLL